MADRIMLIKTEIATILVTTTPTIQLFAEWVFESLLQ